MGFKRPGAVRGRVGFYGSREEQLNEVFNELRSRWSQLHHVPMQLYSLMEDCPHQNPEGDERFDGVDDLVDEWMQRNCPGLTSADWMLYYKNAQRARLTIPLVAEYDRAMSEYEDLHSGNICLGSPMGHACQGCTEEEGESDFGIEPGGCLLPERARQEWDDFWASLDPDA